MICGCVYCVSKLEIRVHGLFALSLFVVFVVVVLGIFCLFAVVVFVFCCCLEGVPFSSSP